MEEQEIISRVRGSMTRILEIVFLSVFGGFLLPLLPSPARCASESPSRNSKQSAPASMVFKKDIKQGQYEHLKISLDENGQGKFEAILRNGDPILMDVQARPASMKFLLSTLQSMQFLSSNQDYDSHLKVADRGLKTFSLAQNGQSREVQYNYTTNKPMAAITDYFEGLISTLLRMASLDNAMKFDKLGLPEQLTALQSEMNHSWLSELELLLPILKKIANNSAYFNIVQRKAHQLILQIESMKPSP